MIGTFTTNGVVDEETQKNGLYIVSGWGRSNYIGQDLTLPTYGDGKGCWCRIAEGRDVAPQALNAEFSPVSRFSSTNETFVQLVSSVSRSTQSLGH
jgi:hypothetical protein